MFEPQNLTAGQVSALSALRSAMSAGQRLFILWYGGVRAGKSTGAAMLLLKHSLQRQGATYIVASHTQRQAVGILMPIFERLAGELGMKFRGSRGSTPYMKIGDNTFLIYGGGETGKDSAVQGYTLAGLLLDEYPLLHPDFIAQAEARVSESGALRVYTANKASPYHWTTRHYYNRAKSGAINAVLIDSDIQDNQHIQSDYISERLTEYADIHRERFILNQFTLDAPPVYEPQYDESVSGAAAISVINVEGYNAVILNGVPAEYGVCVNVCDILPAPAIANYTDWGQLAMVNSDRPLLARFLRQKGVAVRAYRSAFEPRRVESLQMALADGSVRINPLIDELTQAINEYNLPGLYKSPVIPPLESLGEYAIRRGFRNAA